MFERVAWSEEAERGLDETFREAGADPVRELIDSGQAELWRINRGESWMVTRLEGNELNVICLQGRDIHPIAEQVIAHARSQGIDSVRFHTLWRGLGRMLERHGFELVDLIYRAKV